MAAGGLRVALPETGRQLRTQALKSSAGSQEWNLYNAFMGSLTFSGRHPILQRILDWLPAALSVLMIVLESTATMSASNTSQWLYPFWVKLFGPVSSAHWNEVHHLIRKTGHFVGYGIVSLAFFYSWRQTLHRMAVKHWTLWRRASVLAVVCTLLIASLDEFHQSFLPSRTASPVDVGIDLCGAIAAQLILLLIISWFSRRPDLSAA
jgi:VanZ family protein